MLCHNLRRAERGGLTNKTNLDTVPMIVSFIMHVFNIQKARTL